MTPIKTEQNAFTVPVYRADQLYVASGAHLGDSMSIADDLDLGDTYELRKGTAPVDLSIAPAPQGGLRVAPLSAQGRAGARLCVDCGMTVMSQCGLTAEILVLVELDAQAHIAEIYALPLAALMPRLGYTLVSIDRAAAPQKFAQAACVPFTRGTRIALATGAQKPVQDLAPGDLVLTRDAGAQPLRWIGHATERAVGALAPVLIRAGALDNPTDLRVSPDHRLFVYDGADPVGTARRIRAGQLIDNDGVVQEAGGFVDYYQLRFDAPQIIYAEGVASETLRLDRRAEPAVAPDLHRPLVATLTQAANGPGAAQNRAEERPAPDRATRRKEASLP